MTTEAMMRMLATQLRESGRVQSVNAQLVQDIACLDVVDNDGIGHYLTSYILGGNYRPATPVESSPDGTIPSSRTAQKIRDTSRYGKASGDTSHA